jgi:hypothetical protein
MSTGVELRRGVYRDSVTLMRVSEAIIGRSGVEAAIVAMATPLNVELYERLGFDRAAVAEASVNDLLVAIRADGEDVLDAMISVAPALGNAIGDAVGVELLHMPIRAEDVWRAMHDKEPIGNWITKEPVGRCRSARTPVAATATR